MYFNNFQFPAHFLLQWLFAILHFAEKSMTEDNIERHVADLDLPLFDLPTITTATNNFWMENKIGQGGFGPVYKVSQYFSAITTGKTSREVLIL